MLLDSMWGVSVLPLDISKANHCLLCSFKSEAGARSWCRDWAPTCRLAPRPSLSLALAYCRLSITASLGLQFLGG